MIRFRVLVGVLLGLLLVVSPLDPAQAQTQPQAVCPDIKFLGSRGSGETLASRPISLAGAEFYRRLTELLQNKTFQQWVNPYPAVPVGRSSNPENDGGWPDLINGIGAVTNTKWLGKYHKSVADGEKLLTEKITETIRDCSTTQLVLSGYSQGGQVTGNVYQQLTASQRTRILGVVLFGDPLFNGSDEAANRGSYEPERNGLLRNAPRGEFPDPQKVLSFCHRDDPICQGLVSWELLHPIKRKYNFDQHRNYHTLGDAPGEPLYPDTAAQYFANRVRPAPPSTPGPTAEITPLDDQATGVLFRISGCATESRGRPLIYDWDLDNSGAFATRSPGCVLRTSFASTGDYPVGLRVTNDADQQSFASTVVHVVNPDPFTGVPQAPSQVVSTPDGDGAVLTWQPPTSGPPAEGYQVFAADGTILVTIDGGGPGSYRIPAEDLPLAVMVQSISRAGPGGVSAPVTMYVDGAVPAGDLNTMWNAYGDQGGHWTGGDRTTSVPLPDGRVAWLFSDTYLGTVNSDHSRPANSPMVHNTLVVENDFTLGPTLHGGTPAAPRSLVEVSGSAEQYWVADGTVERGQLRVLYNIYDLTGGGGLDVRLRGTALATFSLPNLALTSVRVLPLSDTIAWGSEILVDNGFAYIYGAEHNTDMAKYLHLARVPVDGLDGPWEFWTGTGWSTVESQSARMLTGVGTAFSVTKMGAEYVLITIDSSIPFNSTIIAYTSSSPTGPFGNPRNVYQAPEVGADGRPIIVYDATIHPEHSWPGKLAVSYNVNSLNPQDPIADVQWYRPRFVNVAWPLPVPDPGSLPPAPTNLTATDAGNGNARLSWHGVPGTGITYRVYQRDLTLGQEHPVRRSEKFTSTTAEVTFLHDLHQYEFQVTAENATGEGPPSNTAALTAHVPPPAAPTNLTARPNDGGAISLAWTASTSTGSIWYRVYRRDATNDTGFFPINFPNSTSTSVTDENLEQDHVYEYKVTSNRSGQESQPSNVVQAKAHYAAPAAPTNLRATPRSDGHIDLTWDPPPGGNAWYFVYQRDVTDNPDAPFVRWDPPVTQGPFATAMYLVHGRTYEFEVSATTRGGEGPRSAPARATAHQDPPGVPTNLIATPNGDGTIRLAWNASGDRVWYLVYQRNVSKQEEEFTRWRDPVVEGTTATATYLNAGDTYEFQVSATTAGGQSPRSNTAQAKAVVAPPPAPTGLTATPNPDGTIRLAWTAPREGLWYFVYQREVGEADFVKWDLPVTSGTTAIAGYLTHGKTYEFKITSTYAGEESVPTPLVPATARVAPPTAAPTGLVAAATNDGRAQLSWTGPAPNLWYFVYSRDVDAGQTLTRWAYPTTTPDAIADFLVSGHTYEFAVSATNAGGEGPRSAPVQILAHGGTPPPPTLSATPGDGRATLSWSAVPGADYYWIYRRNASANQPGYTRFPNPTQALALVDTFLENGVTYEYRVSASNVHGEGAWSAPAQARPLPPLPPAPTGLVATAGDGRVTLRWNSVPNAWYVVEHRNVSAGQPFQWAPTLSAATTWTHTFLNNGDTYEYRVRANNVAGDGPPTGTARARPMPPFPQPPSGLVATAGDGRVTLAWQPSSTPSVGYWVEYRMNGSGWNRLPYPVLSCCTHTLHLLANGTTYEFQVRATNLSGDSAPTNVTSARPMPPLPGPPTNLRFTYTYANGGRLDWSPSPTPNVYYFVYERDVSAHENFRRYVYPIDGTSLDVGNYRFGHRYELYITASNITGMSGESNHVFINPGPQDGTSGCASVTSSYQRTNLGGGAIQFDYPNSTLCGYRHGDTMSFELSWTTYGHHLQDGFFWYRLFDCSSGRLVWYDTMSYPDNPPITSDGRSRWSYIDSSHRYRVDVAGNGDVASPFGSARFDIIVPNGIIPFNDTSGCF